MGPVSVIPWVWRRGLCPGKGLDSHWGCPTHVVFPWRPGQGGQHCTPKFWEVTRSKASGEAQRLDPQGPTLGFLGKKFPFSKSPEEENCRGAGVGKGSPGRRRRLLLDPGFLGPCKPQTHEPAFSKLF